MKAIISAQAGAVALCSEQLYRVADVEKQQFSQCDDSTLFSSFSDTSDIVEIEVQSEAEALAELLQRWREDRCLRLIIILLDTQETASTRSSAAVLAGVHLSDQPVLRSVTFRLFSRPFPEGVDIASAKKCLGADNDIVRRLLDDVAGEQQNIDLIRSAWDRCMVELSSQQIKIVLERYLITRGAFYQVAKTVRPDGSVPAEVSTRLTELASASSFRDAGTLMHAWLLEIDLSQRARLAIRTLTVKQALRIKKYADHAIKALGHEARERNAEAFIRDAAISVFKSANPPIDAKDFYKALLAVLPKTLALWHLDVWQSFVRLTESDLVRIRAYARARVKLIGSKAEGRSGDDLVHEAITATFSGSRPWAGNVDLCSHLLGAIRSISSSWGAKTDDLLLESDITREDQPSPIEQFPAGTTPADILEKKERFEATRELFSADGEARQIIDMLVEGYTRAEIKARLRLSEPEYAAAVKRIRRKVAAAA